jgi:hypothetical protein
MKCNLRFVCGMEDHRPSAPARYIVFSRAERRAKREDEARIT